MILTRSLILLSLSAMLIATTDPASAQTAQDLMEVARSVINADRKAIVVKEMRLTEDESKDFWPLYRDYRSAMDKINDELMNLVLDYAKVYPDVPEAQAKDMLDTYTSLQAKHVQQRASYLKQFSNVLPAVKALRFAQVETRLDLLVQLNLAARIPLTPVESSK
jgi:hypothetical protein